MSRSRGPPRQSVGLRGRHAASQIGLEGWKNVEGSASGGGGRWATPRADRFRPASAGGESILLFGHRPLSAILPRRTGSLLQAGTCGGTMMTRLLGAFQCGPADKSNGCYAGGGGGIEKQRFSASYGRIEFSPPTPEMPSIARTAHTIAAVRAVVRGQASRPDQI